MRFFNKLLISTSTSLICICQGNSKKGGIHIDPCFQLSSSIKSLSNFFPLQTVLLDFDWSLTHSFLDLFWWLFQRVLFVLRGLNFSFSFSCFYGFSFSCSESQPEVLIIFLSQSSFLSSICGWEFFPLQFHRINRPCRTLCKK